MFYLLYMNEKDSAFSDVAGEYGQQYSPPDACAVSVAKVVSRLKDHHIWRPIIRSRLPTMNRDASRRCDHERRSGTDQVDAAVLVGHTKISGSRDLVYAVFDRHGAIFYESGRQHAERVGFDDIERPFCLEKLSQDAIAMYCRIRLDQRSRGECPEEETTNEVDALGQVHARFSGNTPQTNTNSGKEPPGTFSGVPDVTQKSHARPPRPFFDPVKDAAIATEAAGTMDDGDRGSVDATSRLVMLAHAASMLAPEMPD